MTDQESTPKKGWYMILNSRKWHYFVEGERNISLCGRYGVIALNTSELHDDFHFSEDNCRECMRRRSRRFGNTEGQ